MLNEDLLENIFLGVFSKNANSLAGYPLNSKIVYLYADKLQEFLIRNNLEQSILESDNCDYPLYRDYLVNLVTKYKIGRYNPLSDKIIISITRTQMLEIELLNKDISHLVDECFEIVNERMIEKFYTKIIDGDSESNELIDNPIYSEETYKKVHDLVQEYNIIKARQKAYPMKTRKEKQATKKKLRSDKKRLTAIANNIIYGYTDIFIEYYSRNKQLLRHYNNEIKKEVNIGPKLTRKIDYKKKTNNYNN